ncbi:MAG: TspO/MBR family protein [Candidatus Paceibacterota bacterium]|jgi:tryptophan-rich sensory protein
MQEIKQKISLFVFIAIVEAIQFLGAFPALGAVTTWYPDLAKPFFNPPNWLFAPVWTILYLLIALSGWMIWKEREGKERAVDLALTVYSIQLVLNAVWSYLFFGSRLLGLAFGEIVILWLAIAANIYFFKRISKRAAYLLVPYILWVSFAALLNFSVWQLNP